MTEGTFTKVSVKQANDIDAANAYYVTLTDTLTGEVEEFTVHTNADGDGLWKNDQQIAGTSQFSLRGIADKASKIRREFE